MIRNIFQKSSKKFTKIICLVSLRLIGTTNVPLILFCVLLETGFIFLTHVKTRLMSFSHRLIAFPGYILTNVAESVGKLSYFFHLIKRKTFVNLW